MADSSLNIIKKAEHDAMEIIKAARIKANGTILNAKNKAKSLTDLVLERANTKAKEIVEVAENEALEYLRKKHTVLDADVLKFREEVLKKEDEAIKAVVDLVFNDF